MTREPGLGLVLAAGQTMRKDGREEDRDGKEWWSSETGSRTGETQPPDSPREMLYARSRYTCTT
ncbi:hypothetical protein E2C01_037842 [Portunus trituberculatus]|uniref:Uncharacterized protein n=1 Tax=Portunus trituberculatus TaxID=210409 RepID=A0A5B7FF69_PORTR|nr:hypothetical protein [Portunus trituberculatus]